MNFGTYVINIINKLIDEYNIHRNKEKTIEKFYILINNIRLQKVNIKYINNINKDNEIYYRLDYDEVIKLKQNLINLIKEKITEIQKDECNTD